MAEASSAATPDHAYIIGSARAEYKQRITDYLSKLTIQELSNDHSEFLKNLLNELIRKLDSITPSDQEIDTMTDADIKEAFWRAHPTDLPVQFSTLKEFESHAEEVALLKECLDNLMNVVKKLEEEERKICSLQ